MALSAQVGVTPAVVEGLPAPRPALRVSDGGHSAVELGGASGRRVVAESGGSGRRAAWQGRCSDRAHRMARRARRWRVWGPCEATAATLYAGLTSPHGPSSWELAPQLGKPRSAGLFPLPVCVFPTLHPSPHFPMVKTVPSSASASPSSVTHTRASSLMVSWP